MAKNYTDELARWATKRQGKAREKNLVTFHALQDDVRAALDAGFSAKTIWAHMQEQGRVDFGYETFLDYVKRVIKTSRIAKPSTRAGEMPSNASRATDPLPLIQPPLTSSQPNLITPPVPSIPSFPSNPSIHSPTRRTGMPTFTFNPIPDPEDHS